MIKRFILLASLLFIPIAAIPATVSAVDVFDRDICERFKDEKEKNKPAVCQDDGINQDGKVSNNNPIFGPDGILTTLINILSIIVGIAAIIIIMLAGLRFITSGSNPQDVTNARERVIYAIVGLIVATLAQIIVRFILGKVNIL